MPESDVTHSSLISLAHSIFKQVSKEFIYYRIIFGIMTSPCLVCFKEVNMAIFPGLKCNKCTKYQCETCLNIMGGNCSICDRSNTNRERSCNNCGEPIRTFQSRVCEVCQGLCCVGCSDKEDCCVSSSTNQTICIHCVCSNC